MKWCHRTCSRGKWNSGSWGILEIDFGDVIDITNL